MLSYPPSSHMIAITLNILDAVQLGVATVSSSILGRHLIHHVMKLGRKPDAIPNLIFGEIPLWQSKAFIRILSVHVYGL